MSVNTTFTNHSSVGATEYTLSEQEFRTIARTLLDEAGIYLSDDKKSLVYARLAKRLRKLGISSFGEYCTLIESKEGTEERRAMLAALTTNVTHFFREAHHFKHLKETVLPPLLNDAKTGGKVRIWSAGCSNGQEPYSIALTILELLPEASSLDVKILATDIDPNMLQDGRQGRYEERTFHSLPPGLLEKYFQKDTEATSTFYTANAELKKLVSFKELNLIAPTWPMKGKFDVIFCRNVVIYFQMDTQAVIWQRYADHLNPEGYLYTGHSERISGQASDRFTGDGITTYKLK